MVTPMHSKQDPPMLLEYTAKLSARYGFHTAISTTSAPVSPADGSVSIESQPSMAS
jgi:hypothetical protein